MLLQSFTHTPVPGHFSRLTLVVIFAVILFNIWFGLPYRDYMFHGDGAGYYAYLPAVIIEGSFDFENVLQKEQTFRHSSYQGHYYVEKGSGLINKFYSGWAIFMLPFFLIAFLIVTARSGDLSGYEVAFADALAIGGVFYLLCGLYGIYRLSKSYGISESICIYALFFLSFGTNLFYYAIIHPTFSHIVSFACISILLWRARVFFIKPSQKKLLTLATLLALIYLVRPTNVLIIFFLPALATGPKNFLSSLRSVGWMKLIPALLLFFGIASFQTFIYFIQSGAFVWHSYPGEAFLWLEPHILDMLFSYKKGLFVWTPLMLLMIPSWFGVLKYRPYLGWIFLFYIIALTYVLSSWWNWYYGDSIGMRALVDHYAVFSLIIILGISYLRSKILKHALVVVAVFLLLVNQIQIYQYRKNIIHPDAMNKTKYWQVFLKTSDEYSGVFGEESEDPYFVRSSEVVLADTFMPGKQNKYWNAPPSNTHSGKYVICLDEKIHFGASFLYPLPFEEVKMFHWYVEACIEFYEAEINAALPLLWVLSVEDEKKQTLYYKAFRLKNEPDQHHGIWRSQSIGCYLPRLAAGKHIIKMYLWNQGKAEVCHGRIELVMKSRG